jgi:hypothetical protein
MSEYQLPQEELCSMESLAILTDHIFLEYLASFPRKTEMSTNTVSSYEERNGSCTVSERHHVQRRGRVRQTDGQTDGAHNHRASSHPSNQHSIFPTRYAPSYVRAKGMKQSVRGMKIAGEEANVVRD